MPIEQKIMATIIGRKKEQKELRRLYESDEAEMIVVYGRRRVGKTYLVNQTFANVGFTFKVTGIHKARMAEQYMAVTQDMDGSLRATEGIPDKKQKRASSHVVY